MYVHFNYIFKMIYWLCTMYIPLWVIFQLFHGENKLISMRWWWSLVCTRPTCLPSSGLHNAHPLLALKISRKKLVRVYNAHGLSKKIAVGNVRIKYQSYIFFSPLSMFHLLGEFKNHLSLFIFNKVAKYQMCWDLLAFSYDVFNIRMLCNGFEI